MAGLAIRFRGWEGFAPAEQHALAAVAGLLLMATGFTILRVIGRQEQLIGELRASEHKTSEYRDLLHTTLCSIGDAVIVTDARGIINFLNPEATRISGWAGEAIGQPLSVVFAIPARTSPETERPAENGTHFQGRKGDTRGQ